MDLIRRILSLKEAYLDDMNQRFDYWLKTSKDSFIGSFQYMNQNYFIQILNSAIFNDFILEDSNDWLYSYSEDDGFQCLIKILNFESDLINDKATAQISSSIWILKSNLENLEIILPIQILSPHNFENKIDKVDRDFLQLIRKLDNPNITLTKFTGSIKLEQSYKEKIR